MARVLVGTSGWDDTVELNGVFYRTPTAESVRRWRYQTGRGFVFACKALKFITHWKRLTQNSINNLQLLDERLSILADKAGPILFQLPPDFAAAAGRLGSFLTLPHEHRRYSFEFRHPSCTRQTFFDAGRSKYSTLYLRSPRCPDARGMHRGLRLFAWPWPERPIRRSLLASNACRLAQVDPAVAAE
jgi:uncharacterized protein YecE (DUF72 family)